MAAVAAAVSTGAVSMGPVSAAAPPPQRTGSTAQLDDEPVDGASPTRQVAAPRAMGVPAPRLLAGPAKDAPVSTSVAPAEVEDLPPAFDLAELVLPVVAGARGIPEPVLAAYVNAADATAAADPGCGLTWEVLAGIGRIESGHASGGRVDDGGATRGRILGPRLDGTMAGVATISDSDGGALDGDPVYDRAVGPMQFIPGTWSGYAADGNGDGVRDPHNVYDATLAAAEYLCAGGGDLGAPADLSAALFRYNRSAAYGLDVQAWAEAYRTGGAPVIPAQPGPVPVPPPPADRPPLDILAAPEGTPAVGAPPGDVGGTLSFPIPPACETTDAGPRHARPDDDPEPDRSPATGGPTDSTGTGRHGGGSADDGDEGDDTGEGATTSGDDPGDSDPSDGEPGDGGSGGADDSDGADASAESQGVTTTTDAESPDAVDCDDVLALAPPDSVTGAVPSTGVAPSTGAGTAGPETTDAETTDAETTDAESGDPATTDAGTTDPESGDAGTTGPETTGPESATDEPRTTDVPSTTGAEPTPTEEPDTCEIAPEGSGTGNGGTDASEGVGTLVLDTTVVDESDVEDPEQGALYLRVTAPVLPEGCELRSATLELDPGEDADARTLEVSLSGSETGPEAEPGPGTREWTVTELLEELLREGADAVLVVRDTDDDPAAVTVDPDGDAPRLTITVGAPILER